MGIYVVSYVIITFSFVLLANKRFKISGRPLIIDSSYNGKYEGQMKLFIVFSCALLICIVGLRSEYQGIDLHNSLGTGYFYVYDIVCGDTVADIFRYFGVKRYANFEIGFVLFNKLISTLSKEHWILLFATSLISIAPVGYYISVNSQNPWLSFMLYMSFSFFSTAYFSAIRQGIAIGIVVISYEFVKRKKLLPFLLTIALAVTFHKSSIVCIIAYPIYHAKISKRASLIGGLAVLAVIYIARFPLFMVLSRTLRETAEIDSNGAVNFFLLLTMVYALCTVFGNERDRELCGLRNLFWLACASQAFAGLYSTAGRITWYFLPPLLVLIPKLLAEAKIKERQLLKPLSWGVGVMAILLGLYYLRYDSIAKAYPYIPFWLQGGV